MCVKSMTNLKMETIMSHPKILPQCRTTAGTEYSANRSTGLRYQSQNEHIDLTKNRNTTILPKVLRFGGPIRFQFTAGATE